MGGQARVSFTVKQARDAASQWVSQVAAGWPGFEGAFLHGSITWLPYHAILPATSDVDLIVVLSGDELRRNPGKFRYDGILLDVSILPADRVQSAEQILGISHLAGSLCGASIVADPTGHLSIVHSVVARDFAKREWVIRRCEHAESKILSFLGGISADAPLHDNVMSWLFGTGCTTHVLLVAGLRNPTVRSRYVAVHDLLAEYGRLDIHEELLALLGAADLSREQVEHQFAAMTEAFDVTRQVIRTPVFFASDFSDVARPIAIDGTREMIDRGYHREAMFWIAATYARCQRVLATDASLELQDRFSPDFEHMLRDLGVVAYDDLYRRADEVRAYLPRLWEVAEQIMDSNLAIEV
jgi:hypothetical protein